MVGRYGDIDLKSNRKCKLQSRHANSLSVISAYSSDVVSSSETSVRMIISLGFVSTGCCLVCTGVSTGIIIYFAQVLSLRRTPPQSAAQLQSAHGTGRFRSTEAESRIDGTIGVHRGFVDASRVLRGHFRVSKGHIASDT